MHICNLYFITYDHLKIVFIHLIPLGSTVNSLDWWKGPPLKDSIFLQTLSHPLHTCGLCCLPYCPVKPVHLHPSYRDPFWAEPHAVKCVLDVLSTNVHYRTHFCLEFFSGCALCSLILPEPDVSMLDYSAQYPVSSSFLQPNVILPTMVKDL